MGTVALDDAGLRLRPYLRREGQTRSTNARVAGSDGMPDVVRDVRIRTEHRSAVLRHELLSKRGATDSFGNIRLVHTCMGGRYDRGHGRLFN